MVRAWHVGSCYFQVREGLPGSSRSGEKNREKREKFTEAPENGEDEGLGVVAGLAHDEGRRDGDAHEVEDRRDQGRLAAVHVAPPPAAPAADFVGQGRRAGADDEEGEDDESELPP